MRVKVLGKTWTLQFVPLADCRGLCEGPHDKGKRIKIDSRLEGEERLEVVIHELIHAAGWHLDEQFVATFSVDLARVLTRLGYHDD